MLATPVSAKPFEYKRWSEAKCQTYLDHNMGKKRRLLSYCAGRMSKAKYAYYYAVYFNYIYQSKHVDEAASKALRRAVDALSRHDVKWMSDKRQKMLDDLKLGSSISGAIIGAMLLAGAVAWTSAGGVSTLFFMTPVIWPKDVIAFLA